MADQKISQLTEKATLVGNDIITILDSEAANANKKAKISALPQLTATAPVEITNGVVSMQASGNGVDGYLTGSNWVTFNSKANTQSLSEDTTSTTASLTVNTSGFYNKIYRYTQPLTELTLSGAPIETTGSTYRYDTEIQFTTGATFTFTATGFADKWIGIDAPTFDINTTYVIAIKNGYAALGKVGA